MDCLVVIPKENQLQIDLDTEEAHTNFCNRRAEIEDRFFWTWFDYCVWYSGIDKHFGVSSLIRFWLDDEYAEHLERVIDLEKQGITVTPKSAYNLHKENHHG